MLVQDKSVKCKNIPVRRSEYSLPVMSPNKIPVLIVHQITAALQVCQEFALARLQPTQRPAYFMLGCRLLSW